MTLNITLATPWHVIQASDRRMIWVPDREIDDEANKGLVLKTDDGVFAITFTGVGRWGKKRENRIDLWLAEQMLSQGVPELPIKQGLKAIAKVSTQLFSTFAIGTERRHTFVTAGFEVSEGKSRASVWTVSNCLTENGTMLPSANNEFDVQKHTIDARHALLYVTGLREAVSRDDRKWLQRKLRAGSNADHLEKTVVDVMKIASSKPKWRWGINDNVLAIRVSPRCEVLASHYPSSGSFSRYVPILVWYEAGRNYAAGDALVVSSRKGWRFGPIMYVMPPSSGGPQSKVDFSFRFDNAKHRKDPVGEITIIQEIEGS